MPPCSTKPRLTIGLFTGLSWQGGRFASGQAIGLLRAALARRILLAAAALHKPNHFCPTNRASETTLFGVKSWWIIRQPAHRLAVASPVRGASAKGKQHMRVALLLPLTTPWSGRFHSPLKPIDRAPVALRVLLMKKVFSYTALRGFG
jgi:hypothetical protein